MAKDHDIKTEQTKVGDRYVLERMKEIGASLGGEQSGHVIFLDENTTGDGLLSALHLLQVMVETGRPLSELSTIMEELPQALVNAKVANHKKNIIWNILKLRRQSKNWRINLRERAEYSSVRPVQSRW